MPNEQQLICPDPHCDDIAALMADATLSGEVSPEQQGRLISYLTACERCRQRFEGYAAVGQLLPLSAPEAEPASDLRERILLAASAQKPQPQRKGWRIFPWRRAMVPALALVVLLLATWTGLLQAQRSQEQAQSARNRAGWLAVFGDDDAYEQPLAPTSLAPQASGRAWIAPTTGALGLYVKQLPVLEPGQVYQLWLSQSGSMLSAGVFTTDARGRAYIMFRPPAGLNGLEEVSISVEPAGGGQQPGPVYLKASVTRALVR